jgi:serine/threonine protein kinase
LGLSRVRSPNVVNLYGVSADWSDENRPSVWLVMELFDLTLDDLKGPVSSRDAVHLLLGVARGLRAIHTAGLIHRDIKPENILLRRNADGSHVAVVGDFGLITGLHQSTVAYTTQSGSAGTLAYMAPEQHDPAVGLADITSAADMYAFGVLVWELMTGEVPWYQYPQMKLALSVMGGVRLQFPSPKDEAWASLKELGERCFEPAPAKRPSATEAVETLSRLEEKQVTRDRPRHALVIGNNYDGERHKLPTCLNDARAVAERLRELRFTVTLVEEASLDDLKKAVFKFAQSLPDGALTVFYFSGHGEEEGGHNYIIPTRIDSSLPPRLAAFSTNDLVKELGASSDVTIIILDACRFNASNDAFKAAAKGAGAVLLKDVNALASKAPDVPRNTTQQFAFLHAADPGCVAYAGQINGFSAFTACLLEVLRKGSDLFDISMHLANRVPAVANQRPWISTGGLREKIVF